jgi:hypothetical protein
MIPFRLIAALVLTLSSPLAAQVVWSVPAQYPTIQGAIVAAGPGDRVEVASGVYNEIINFLGKDIEVIGVAGAANTTIDGTAFHDAVVTANSGEPLTARILGFTLTGGRGKPFPSSYGFDYYGGGIYVGGNGSNLCIEQCWILNNAVSTGTFGGGVCVAGGNARAEVHRCLIAGNRAWASGGATLVTGTNSTMLLDRCTITNNTATSWAFGYQGGVSMANGGGVDLVSCIVWGNAGYQIGAFGAPYNAGTYANAAYCCVQNGFAGTGNLATDPLFINQTTADYRLQSGSPCINAGDPTSTADPDGSRADMGCFPLLSGPAAAFTTFGAGCPGTSGLTTLAAVPGSLPRLGQDFEIRFGNLPNVATVVLPILGLDNVSWNGSPLPIPLGSYGMTGCSLYTLGYATSFLLALAPTWTWSLPIPSNPAFVGVTMYAQAMVFEPGANAFGAVVTNAGALTFGF